MNEIQIIGLREIPLIKKGDDIANIILEALKKNNLELISGDIFVIAQTIITKSNGRIRNLKQIIPSSRAIEVHNKISSKAKNMGVPEKSPELIQLILDESKEILKVEHILITETEHGFICANAGIDKSNIEGKENVGLLPSNPDEDAKNIRINLKNLTNKDIAIIISDSFGRPFRVGSVGVALGVSGINPILDKRGKRDLFDYELQSTIIGHVDNLASAAQLVMGEADEGIPIVLIRGYDFELTENISIKSLLREKNIDLFRTGTIENTKKILKNRRSYKFGFDSKKVDKKIIEKCIELARWAPSAHNGQQWRYVILSKGSLRDRLIDKINEKLRFDLEKDGRTDAFIRNKINKTRNNFLEAPFLILLCLDLKNLEIYQDEERSQNEFILGIQSVSCSAVYLLIAFEIEKLAACWYCAPLFTKEIIKEVLKLPESYIPMAFFTVGYPLKPIKAPPRKNLNDIIFNLKE
ncbi:MAG: coenzyme F420-0:L-glutamate ligase [Candidatus Hodarchaeota archaeon]